MAVKFSFQPLLFSAFLQHYLSLGIRREHILLIIHWPPDAQGRVDMAALERVTQAFHVRYFLWQVQGFSSIGKDVIRRQVISRYVDRDDWVVYADADELHAFPEALPRFFERISSQSFNAVQGKFVERVSRDGSLLPVQNHSSLWSQFPLECSVTRGVARAGCVSKVLAVRGLLQPGPGAHWLVARGGCPRDSVQLNTKNVCCFRDRVHWFTEHRPFNVCCAQTASFFPLQLKVHHFKFVQGVGERLSLRSKLFEASNNTVSKESKRIMDHLEQHSNRLCTWCEELQCNESDAALPWFPSSHGGIFSDSSMASFLEHAKRFIKQFTS